MLVGWPTLATILEAGGLAYEPAAPLTAGALDAAATSAIATVDVGMARPTRLAIETLTLVAGSETLVLPVGIVLALLLFRTDVWGRRLLLCLLGLAAFIPLPLHATAWLGAFGNAGRTQAIGVKPFLVGRLGVMVITALAALPWVGVSGRRRPSPCRART